MDVNSSDKHDSSSKKSALNVIYIVLDDVGFSDLGCYGSEIETPHIDTLAANGLRYNNFSVTPLCSPTRACLLTGRNCHAVGVGLVSEADLGPEHSNKRGRITPAAATLAEILNMHGFATFAVGKWHLVPGHEAASSGPFDNWPLSKGFQRYYGFLLGFTDQYTPDIIYDNHRIQKPDKENYHLSEDLVDKAMEFMTDHLSVTPERPFFLYLAFGAQHQPHQVPRKFIDKYKGVYDIGWDEIRKERFKRQRELRVIPLHTELVDRNPGIKAWDELTDKEKIVFTRFQQTFAGFLTHTDEQIGRILDFLKSKNQLDQTIVVLLADNGGSQEGDWNGSINHSTYYNGIEESIDNLFEKVEDIGAPDTTPNYPKGWAQVSNTPFKYYKQNTFFGGIHVPLIIHWPQTIRDAGAVRSQFYHAIDITPTILDVLNIQAPKEYKGVQQMPLHGISMADTLTNPDVLSKRRTQYFEMIGHRAIWHDGWTAVTYHEKGTAFNQDNWELYYVEKDFSQKHNLTVYYPQKLIELQKVWWEEAQKYNVLPLDDRTFELLTPSYQGLLTGRSVCTFYPGMAHLPAGAAPIMIRTSYSITIPIFRWNSSCEGVLIAYGDRSSGYTLYIKNNYLIYEYNYVGTVYKIQSATEVPNGYVNLKFKFKKIGFNQGAGMLYINDQQVGIGYIPKTLPFLLSHEGLDIGRDRLAPVSTNYPAPEFPFSGQIEKVIVELRENKTGSIMFSECKKAEKESIYINVNGTIIFL